MICTLMFFVWHFTSNRHRQTMQQNTICFISSIIGIKCHPLPLQRPPLAHRTPTCTSFPSDASKQTKTYFRSILSYNRWRQRLKKQKRRRDWFKANVIHLERCCCCCCCCFVVVAADDDDDYMYVDDVAINFWLLCQMVPTFNSCVGVLRGFTG